MFVGEFIFLIEKLLTIIFHEYDWTTFLLVVNVKTSQKNNQNAWMRQTTLFGFCWIMKYQKVVIQFFLFILIFHIGNCQEDDDDDTCLIVSEPTEESTEKNESKLPLIKRSSIMNSIRIYFTFFR